MRGTCATGYYEPQPVWTLPTTTNTLCSRTHLDLGAPEETCSSPMPNRNCIQASKVVAARSSQRGQASTSHRHHKSTCHHIRQYTSTQFSLRSSFNDLGERHTFIIVQRRGADWRTWTGELDAGPVAGRSQVLQLQWHCRRGLHQSKNTDPPSRAP